VLNQTISRRSLFANLRASADGVLSGVRRAFDEPVAVHKGPRSGYFPNFVVSTHDGREVRFYDDLIRGKIVAINMMYADCTGICPTMTANLLKVQRTLGARLGHDIFMYSITLRPKHDTPAVLNSYAQHHGVGPGWQFLTGKPDEIEVLRRKLGFVDPDPALDRDKSNHTGLVVFGNERLDRWGACPALGPAEQIVKSILWMDPKRQKGGVA
jgi:protein SCO1